MRTSIALYWVAIVGSIAAIFVIDSLTDVRIVVAMLYVAPVLVATRILRPAASIALAVCCGVLAVVSFIIISPSGTRFFVGVVNLLMEFAIIATTTILGLQGRAAVQRLSEQANLLDLTHDAIFVRGMDNMVRYWNRGATELYGWAAAEAVGRTSHDLLATVFPEPLENIEAQLLASGRWDGEVIHTRRDGSRFIVASRWSLHRHHDGRPDAVMETNNDITSRRQAEYLTRQVFEVVPDGMCIVDRDARIQQANAAYGKINGVPPDRVVGMRIPEVIGEEVFQQVSEPRLRRCFSGEESGYASWLSIPAGQRYFTVSYSPLRPDSASVEAVLIVVRDLTDQMLAAEALRTAHAELAHANRVTTMGQLTASIAHEVNQPIHAVGLNARAALRWLTADPPELDEARAAIDRIAHNATRAGDVIARIRGLAKRAPLEPEDIDINSAIRDVLTLTRNEAEKHAVAVEFAAFPDLPPVRGDRVAVQQVVLNLVVNAIEAMAAGETTRWLKVGTEADGFDGVRITVADSGPGIAPESAQRLFEPFFTTKPQGMGMGLSICRTIVQRHGGRLEVSANEPQGTTFVLSLPTHSVQQRGREEAGADAIQRSDSV